MKHNLALNMNVFKYKFPSLYFDTYMSEDVSGSRLAQPAQHVTMSP